MLLDLLDARVLFSSTAPISFCLNQGKLIPVVWKTGETLCAYCGAKSTSYQGIHKHMKLNHEDEMEQHEKIMRINGGGLLEKRLYEDRWSFAVLQHVAHLDEMSTEDDAESDLSASDRQVKAKRKRNEEPT